MKDGVKILNPPDFPDMTLSLSLGDRLGCEKWGSENSFPLWYLGRRLWNNRMPARVLRQSVRGVGKKVRIRLKRKWEQV